MTDLIIPNWHPLLVHFTIALITVSAGFMLASRIKSTKAGTFALVGKWTLWAGASITLLTILAGFAAYNSVAHDDIAHTVMKTHRNWALASSTAIIVLAIWSWLSKPVTTLMAVSGLLVAALVGVTGFLGAELVYRHGIGVMRLPDVTGAGHSHSDSDHDHGSTTGSDVQAHDNPDLSSHAHHDEAAASLSDPTAVAETFINALRSGQKNTVAQILADDVLIMEGGHAQTSKAEYMSGHMISDMAFLPNIDIEKISQSSGKAGDIAWVTTHSTMKGHYKGQKIDQNSRSFLLLKKVAGHWKITHIDWAQK